MRTQTHWYRLTSPTPSASLLCRSRSASVPLSHSYALRASLPSQSSGHSTGIGTVSRGKDWMYPQNSLSGPRRSSCSRANASPRIVCEVVCVSTAAGVRGGREVVRSESSADFGILHTGRCQLDSLLVAGHLVAPSLLHSHSRSDPLYPRLTRLPNLEVPRSQHPPPAPVRHGRDAHAVRPLDAVRVKPLVEERYARRRTAGKEAVLDRFHWAVEQDRVACGCRVVAPWAGIECNR